MSADRATAPPPARRYAGASAEERRADRRARLIRAAITVYGDCGYRRATVSAVCRVAGLTPRYFYEAFANSEALLAAAFEEVADFVIGHVTEVARAAESVAEDRLRAMLHAYYALLRAEPASARVFLLEMADIAPAIDRLFTTSLERFATLIARILRPDGRDSNADLRRTGAIYGLLHIARAWVIGGYAEPVETVVAAAMPLCRLLASDADGA